MVTVSLFLKTERLCTFTQSPFFWVAKMRNFDKNRNTDSQAHPMEIQYSFVFCHVRLNYQWIVLRYNRKYGQRISSVSGGHLLSQISPPNYFFFFASHDACPISWEKGLFCCPCFVSHNALGTEGCKYFMNSLLASRVFTLLIKEFQVTFLIKHGGEVTKVSDGPCT